METQVRRQILFLLSGSAVINLCWITNSPAAGPEGQLTDVEAVIAQANPAPQPVCDEKPDEKKQDETFFESLRKQSNASQGPSDEELIQWCEAIRAGSGSEAKKESACEKLLAHSDRPEFQEGYRQGFSGAYSPPYGMETRLVGNRLFKDEKDEMAHLGCAKYAEKPHSFRACMVGFLMGQRLFGKRFSEAGPNQDRPSRGCYRDYLEGVRFGEIACKVTRDESCGSKYTPHICNPGCFSAGSSKGERNCLSSLHVNENVVYVYSYGLTGVSDANALQNKGLSTSYIEAVKPKVSGAK